MANIRWTSQAVDDLEAITKYIARDSMFHAELFACDVLGAIDRLETFPLSGRVVPEVEDSAIREILKGRYRIIYRVRDDQVELLTIYHGARLLDLRRIQ